MRLVYQRPLEDEGPLAAAWGGVTEVTVHADRGAGPGLVITERTQEGRTQLIVATTLGAHVATLGMGETGD